MATSLNRLELFNTIAQKGSRLLEEENSTSKGNFILDDLNKILNNIEQSALGSDRADDFVNLFEDLDLTSSKLRATTKAKNKLIAKVLLHLDQIDFKLDDGSANVLC